MTAASAAGCRGPPPAARGLATRYDRRARRLVVTLRGAAPRAVVEAGGRRVAVRGGTLVLRGVGPGRIVRARRAPRARAGITYRGPGFLIPSGRAARVRVARL